MSYKDVDEQWMSEQFVLLNLDDISSELWEISEEIFAFRRKTQYAKGEGLEGPGLLLRRGFDNLYDIIGEKIFATRHEVYSCQKVFVELLESENEDVNYNASRKMYVYCKDLLTICDKFLEEIEDIKEQLDQS